MKDENFCFRYITTLSKNDITSLELTKENIMKFKKCMNTNLKLEIMYILSSNSNSSKSLNDIVSYTYKYNRLEIQRGLYSLLKYSFIGRSKRKNNLYYYKIKEIGMEALEFIYINYVKNDKYLKKFIQQRNRKIQSFYNYDYIEDIDKKNRVLNKYTSKFIPILIMNIFTKIIYGKTNFQLRFESKQKYINSTPELNYLRELRFFKKEIGKPYNLPYKIEFNNELFRLKKISKVELDKKNKPFYDKIKEYRKEIHIERVNDIKDKCRFGKELYNTLLQLNSLIIGLPFKQLYLKKIINRQLRKCNEITDKELERRNELIHTKLLDIEKSLLTQGIFIIEEVFSKAKRLFNYRLSGKTNFNTKNLIFNLSIFKQHNQVFGFSLNKFYLFLEKYQDKILTKL